MLILILYTNRSQYGCRKKIVLTLVIWFSETMIICAEQNDNLKKYLQIFRQTQS